MGAIAGGAEVAVTELRSGRDGPGHVLLALAEVPAASDPQLDLLADAAIRLSDPGCFVIVSAAGSGREGLIRRLKMVHPHAEIAVVAPGRTAA
jgi:hypothetical protein